MNAELLYMMALTKIPKLNFCHQRQLLELLGSACAVYENRNNILDVIPEASPALGQQVALMDSYLQRCEEEIHWANSHRVECISINDNHYPVRLKECSDAPLVLYSMGNANLNTRRIVSIVGTRKITDYGRRLCEKFIAELSELCPDVLVVSGLAYGVDIYSHRQALQNQLNTIGVLAHGLDQIYPTLHRQTAKEMLEHGGLLTEFMSQTTMSKRYFLQRNRIVAGCADATIVVESASHGGSLVTAEIAQGYGREVFAFPGRITDHNSAGCNTLISTNAAAMLLNAEDFIYSMGWQEDVKLKKNLKDGIQQELFPQFSDEEQLIVNLLSKQDKMQFNSILLVTGLPTGKLSGLLFTLEMRGVVRMMPGGMYALNM